MHRAGDAFELALESYNRRSLRHRLQAFCLQMVDAWEMLLKGERVEARGTDAIEGPSTDDDNSEAERTDSPPIWSLEQMLDDAFDHPDHPVRANITHLLTLCDQREYLLVPDLEPAVVEVFRAAGFNFRRRYRGVVDADPVAHAPAQLALSAQSRQVNLDVLRQRYGHRTYERAKQYLDRLSSDRQRLKSRRFAISTDYQLALTRRLDDNDISIDRG
jgi:hypothetical protein